MTSVTSDPLPTQLPLPRSGMAWQVNAEPVVFAGGGRALLLQVAHPGVGAGVEQHSTYQSDPWGRFFRTVDVMMKLSFGSPEVSARQRRMLERMHRRVVGTTDDGTPYDAMDPDLQLWVWATLVDTALMVHQRVHRRLTRLERERYYQESTLVAHGCGVPVGNCPEDWAAFRSYFQDVVSNDLRVTDAARAVAHAAMVPPLPSPLDRVSAIPNRLVTVGLLPPNVRDQYGFRWNRADQRRLDNFFRLAAVASRVAPRPVRQLGARTAVSQQRPMRIPWLQKRGAEQTARRMASFRPAES